MAAEHEKFWEEVRGKLRRAHDLDPLCQEESEKEYKKAPAEPLSDDDVEDVLAFVRSMGTHGGMNPKGDEADDEDEDDDDIAAGWSDPVTDEMMAGDLQLINRNAGEQDDETSDLVDDLRREALEEAEGGEQDDPADEDELGLEDGEDPSGARR